MAQVFSELHHFTTEGPRTYVRGDCRHCGHTTTDIGPDDCQPMRIVEYVDADDDGVSVAWVSELQPCPWALCPRRRTRPGNG